jgi:hypothetical protein
MAWRPGVATGIARRKHLLQSLGGKRRAHKLCHGLQTATLPRFDSGNEPSLRTSRFILRPRERLAGNWRLTDDRCSHNHGQKSAHFSSPPLTAGTKSASNNVRLCCRAFARTRSAEVHRLPVPRYGEPVRVAGSDHNPLFEISVKLISPGFETLFEGSGQASSVKVRGR